MPIAGPSPTSGKVGRISTFVGKFQRFLNMDRKSKKSKSATVAGTNSEYHLTVTQVNKIINATSNLRDKVLLSLLACTGIRRAEVTDLNAEDVNIEEILLVIRKGKGNKLRMVPLPESILADINDLLGKRKSGPLLVNSKDKRLSLRQINRIVANLGYAANIQNPNPKHKNITCHLFRHTFARLWKDKNGSIESLSKILGHSSVKTTWDLYGTEAISDIQRNYRTVMKKISYAGIHGDKNNKL